jgi:mannose-6-phosphate isomerase class I
LYDYGRLENGKPRELHIEKSKETIDFKKKSVDKVKPKNLINNSNIIVDELISNPYFKLHKAEIKNKENISSLYKGVPFILISCIEGKGKINNEEILKNESVVLTTDELSNIEVEGNIVLLIGYPK